MARRIFGFINGRRVVRNAAGTVTRLLSADAEEIGDYDATGVLVRDCAGAENDNPVAFVTAADVRA